MEKRNPGKILLLGILTCGIYIIFWRIWTKDEMNARGTQIPTAWLWLIPFGFFYWLWKYCEGVEKVTNGELSTAAAFLWNFVPIVPIFVIQNALNKVN